MNAGRIHQMLEFIDRQALLRAWIAASPIFATASSIRSETLGFCPEASRKSKYKCGSRSELGFNAPLPVRRVLAPER